MIRKILRIVGWLVLGIVALVLAAYMILLAINWRDAKPSAEAVRLTELYRNRPPLADEDNGFVYLMGFEVPVDEDPRTMGLKRIAWGRESIQAASWNQAADPLGRSGYERDGRSPAIKQFLDACKPASAGCPAAFLAAEPVREEWMASESWLFERYRRLIAHAGWRESVLPVPEGPMVHFSLAMDGQKLLLLQARALVAKGDHAGARELLEDDLRFWRTMLESSDILITKVLALAGVRNHFKLGNLALREAPPGSAANAMPAGWRSAISDDERSMLRCLTGEWIFASRVISRTAIGDVYEAEQTLLARTTGVLVMPLLKRQDTINRYATHYLHTAESLTVPFDEYDEAVDRLRQEAQQLPEAMFPPRSAYNIVGQILLAVSGGPDLSSYAGRVSDIEGVRRAALLAVTLRAASVKAPQIEAALQHAELRDPYDGKPFVWDEQHGAIVFRGLEPGERGEHRIYY